MTLATKMLRFSHWQYYDRQTFWGWRRECYPVYVETREVFIPVRGEVISRPDPELVRIGRETERMRALKQQLDAEAAMLESYIAVARKQAQLQGLLQVADHRQRQEPDEPKLLTYRPQVPMAKIR